MNIHDRWIKHAHEQSTTVIEKYWRWWNTPQKESIAKCELCWEVSCQFPARTVNYKCLCPLSFLYFSTLSRLREQRQLTVVFRPLRGRSIETNINKINPSINYMFVCLFMKLTISPIFVSHTLWKHVFISDSIHYSYLTISFCIFFFRFMRDMCFLSPFSLVGYVATYGY